MNLINIFASKILTLDTRRRDRVWQSLQTYIASKLIPEAPEPSWLPAVYEFTRRFELEVRDGKVRVKADILSVLATLKAGSKFLVGHRDAEAVVIKAALESSNPERVVTGK